LNNKADQSLAANRIAAPVEVVPATPGPAPLKKATLRMNIQPTDAQVELDGKALPVGIAAYPVILRDEPYRLKVTAPGHRTVEREFEVEGDMELSISLENLTAPAPAVDTSAKKEEDKATEATPP